MPWSGIRATVGDATAALLSIAQAVGTLAIWLGIVVLPLALALALLAAVVLRVPVLRRRLAGERPEEGGISS